MANANTNTRRVSVEGKVKSNGKATAVPFACVLDFSKCSLEEIQQLATDGIVVKLQARARAKYSAKENLGKDKKTPIKSFAVIVKETMTGTIDIQTAIVAKARKPGKSVITKAQEMLAKMNKEERAAALALITGGK